MVVKKLKRKAIVPAPVVKSKEEEELEKGKYRLPRVVGHTDCNIHKFFNRIKNTIVISKDGDVINFRIQHQEKIDQDIRQSCQLRLEQQNTYTTENQILTGKLEDVFDFASADINKVFVEFVIEEKKTNKNILRNYANLHIHPELMEKKPENFLDDWIVVPHPVGQRTILVSNQGQTELYSETGVQLARFKSKLPGGLKETATESSVLDCIWIENKKIIYILDCLFWDQTPLYHCTANERFSYLKNKTKNITKALRIIVEQRNDYSIMLLPFQYTSNDISEFLTDIADINFDKLVFYHRKSLYVSGNTPLVLWLEPYMLPEVLDINVPNQFLSKKPHDYINFTEFKNKVIRNKIIEKKIKIMKELNKKRSRAPIR